MDPSAQTALYLAIVALAGTMVTGILQVVQTYLKNKQDRQMMIDRAVLERKLMVDQKVMEGGTAKIIAKVETVGADARTAAHVANQVNDKIAETNERITEVVQAFGQRTEEIEKKTDAAAKI